MGILNKQVGWSQESNLLWLIAKEIERLQTLVNSGGGGGAVISVNGQTGVVTLTSSDIPDIATTYVPYIGAITDVNLGTQELTAGTTNINGLFHQGFGIVNPANDYTRFDIDGLSLNFICNDGSGLGNIQISASGDDGYALKSFNVDGTAYSIETGNKGLIQKSSVSTIDNNVNIGFIAQGIDGQSSSILSFDHAETEVADGTNYVNTRQEATNWNVHGTGYELLGLIGANFNTKSVHFGDYEGVNNGTEINLNDDTSTIYSFAKDNITTRVDDAINFSEIIQTGKEFKVSNDVYINGLFNINFDNQNVSIGDYSNAQNYINISTLEERIYMQANDKVIITAPGEIALNTDNATVNGFEIVTVGEDNATTVVLSASDLNTAYPDAKTNFVVWCKAIIGGSLRYEKTANGTWVSSPIVVVV